MDILVKFWELNDKTTNTKETQLETYIKNGANEYILRFIKLGGGPSLGCIAEQFAKFKFNQLKNRLKGETSHDHTIVINNKIIKVEQKTSSLNKTKDFMWQHIAEKHPWDILLLMGIHLNEIFFFGMNKTTFTAWTILNDTERNVNRTFLSVKICFNKFFRFLIKKM